MSLRETLSNYWYAFQQELFPRLEMEFAPLSGRYELFVAVPSLPTSLRHRHLKELL